MTPDQGPLTQEVTAGFLPQAPIDRRRILGGLAAVGAGLWLPGYVVEARQTEAETQQNYPPKFGEPLQVDPEIAEMANNAFEEFYPQWIDTWVVEGDSSEEKRVIFTPEDGSTNSEVQAIGMEFAAHVEDWELFDGLAVYMKTHTNSVGLMSHHLAANGSPIDTSSVVDADLGIFQALAMESKKRGNYTDEAREYAENILEHDVDQNTFLFKGGNDWGGPKDGFVNPSYNITGAYLLAHDMFGEKEWLKVKSAQEWLYDRIIEEQSETGLLPNWSAPDGTRVDYDLMKRIFYNRSMSEEEFTARLYAMSHEAGRIFQRVGTGAMWYGSEHDKKTLAKGAEFFATHDPDEISGYTDIQTGEALVNWPESLVLANAAVALTASGDVQAQRRYLEASMSIYDPSSPYVTNQAEPLKSWALLSGKMAA